MAEPTQSFAAFEQAGWGDARRAASYHEQFSALTTQSAEALLDAAGVREGSRVLDVATGAGYVAGTAAKRKAVPIGIDFSEAQVRLARARYPGVHFEQANAEALPFEAASFDAAVNAFGMCHLPNPDIALREAFRVLKRGGRVAFTVWDLPERAVAFGAMYTAIRDHGSMDVGLPAGPNFFLFSHPQQSRKALLDAGFASPSCSLVPQVWRISDVDQLFKALTEGTVRAAATVLGQTPRTRDAIRAALRDAIAPYARGDHYDVPMPAALATALKP